MEQIFVIDNQTKVKRVVEKYSEQINSPIVITDFVRYELGEGIDKTEVDFASEVAATLNN